MPFPPIPTKAIDLLALELYRIATAVQQNGYRPGQWDRDDALQERYRRTARALIGKVGAVAVVLPVPVDVRVEWGVWWTGDDPDGIRAEEFGLSSRALAESVAHHRLGLYGITGYRIVRREHHEFSADTG